ncbi:phage gp6-like head-tail connector protein [Achromobacter sp. KS-M25]|nr:phage gp6-like head-tail connector protein [Achromobacter aestuarii]
MTLVTLEDAKAHLRIDSDDDDADLLLKIGAASSSVLNYMKSGVVFEPKRDASGSVELDADGNVVYTRDVRFEVRAAVLLMLGFLFKNRDDDADSAFEPGYLPRPVTALLYPLRDPALA